MTDDDRFARCTSDEEQRPLTDEEHYQVKERIRETFDEVCAWLIEGDEG